MLARRISAHLAEYPVIRLLGPVGEDMVRSYLSQFEGVSKNRNKIFVCELTTFGGKADYGYRIAEEIRLAREYYDKEPIFLGKTVVYSAGMTILAAFPRERRYLTKHTTLLTHERRIEEDVKFLGPLVANIQVAKELLADFENGKRIQNQNFSQLIEGSDISLREILKRAETGWYISAEEALNRKLVEGLL
ncbi:MAG: ATP-dependent Clp protease proteolytic subunit [Deltaproteobacteria bacterium]|nr:ATP-dependent Clp protease proteolytic subunit [Deltaproteobacteria bacterium]